MSHPNRRAPPVCSHDSATGQGATDKLIQLLIKGLITGGRTASQPTMTDSVCNACLGTWPRQDHFIADLRPHANLSARRPVLSRLDRARVESATQRNSSTSRARNAARSSKKSPRWRPWLADEWRAVKINYGSGNQLPHIHWHLIPPPQPGPGTARAGLARGA